jgi:hypothetical protein
MDMEHAQLIANVVGIGESYVAKWNSAVARSLYQLGSKPLLCFHWKSS